MHKTALLVTLLVAGCSSDPAPPIAGAVECRGTACVCPSAGDCRVNCVGDCNLQCAGSGLCDFTCGPSCKTACTGSGPCVVAVGDDSEVNCTGSGGCDVACTADCAVNCPGSGLCVARCKPGTTCKIDKCSGAVKTCPNGVLACNGDCPPDPPG